MLLIQFFFIRNHSFCILIKLCIWLIRIRVHWFDCVGSAVRGWGRWFFVCQCSNRCCLCFDLLFWQILCWTLEVHTMKYLWQIKRENKSKSNLPEICMLITYLIGCVKSANDFNEYNRSRFECELLPRSKLIIFLVDGHFPILLIHRCFDVETVCSCIAIPKQQTHRTNVIRLTKLHDNDSASWREKKKDFYETVICRWNHFFHTQLMTRIARIPIVVFHISVEKGVASTTHSFDDMSTHINRCYIVCGQNKTID